MKITDEDVLKYCDDLVGCEQSARIQEAARHDVELASRIKAMQASQLPYKAAFAQQREPELPEMIARDVESWVRLSAHSERAIIRNKVASGGDLVRRSYSSPWRALSIAASLAACFVLGYGIASNKFDPDIEGVKQVEDSRTEWVNRVAEYQSLYVENTVVGITDATQAAASLLARLESDSDLRTGIPDLTKLGYEFVRAQELGYEGKPLVQLVYYKPGSAPLALCYMPSDNEISQALQMGEHAGLKTADWIRDGQRYVVVGDESQAVMKDIHDVTSAVFL